MVKNISWTFKQYVKHHFAGQNSQQLLTMFGRMGRWMCSCKANSNLMTVKSVSANQLINLVPLSNFIKISIVFPHCKCGNNLLIENNNNIKIRKQVKKVCVRYILIQMTSSRLPIRMKIGPESS